VKANMGLIDRVVRVLIAAGIGYLYFTGQIEGPVAIGLLVLSAIFVLTSLVGTCPLYLPFGISTRKAKGA